MGSGHIATSSGASGSNGASSIASHSNPRSGRQRDPVRGDAILTVTLKILAARGYAGLTIDEVVRLARVSKATIYRRWPSKERLAVAAFERLPELEVVDRGNLLVELLDLAEQYLKLLHATPLGTVLPAMISEAVHNPQLADELRPVFARRRGPAVKLLERSVERGELDADIDIPLATEIVMAPLVERSFFTWGDDDRKDLRAIFAVLIAGLKAMPPTVVPRTSGG